MCVPLFCLAICISMSSWVASPVAMNYVAVNMHVQIFFEAPPSVLLRVPQKRHCQMVRQFYFQCFDESSQNCGIPPACPQHTGSGVSGQCLLVLFLSLVSSELWLSSPIQGGEKETPAVTRSTGRY